MHARACVCVCVCICMYVCVVEMVFHFFSFETKRARSSDSNVLCFVRSTVAGQKGELQEKVDWRQAQILLWPLRARWHRQILSLAWLNWPTPAFRDICTCLIWSLLVMDPYHYTMSTPTRDWNHLFVHAITSFVSRVAIHRTQRKVQEIGTKSRFRRTRPS